MLEHPRLVHYSMAPCLRGAVDGVLLHVLRHVCILDDCLAAVSHGNAINGWLFCNTNETPEK